MGSAGPAIPGRFDAKQRSPHLSTAPYKTLCSKRGATTCRREGISFLKSKTKCVTVLYFVIRPLPLQLHTLLEPFFAARDVFIDRLLRDRVPGLPHIRLSSSFFSTSVRRFLSGIASTSRCINSHKFSITERSGLHAGHCPLSQQDANKVGWPPTFSVPLSQLVSPARQTVFAWPRRTNNAAEHLPETRLDREIFDLFLFFYAF